MNVALLVLAIFVILDHLQRVVVIVCRRSDESLMLLLSCKSDELALM